jgi:hypothetical protein
MENKTTLGCKPFGFDLTGLAYIIRRTQSFQDIVWLPIKQAPSHWRGVCSLEQNNIQYTTSIGVTTDLGSIPGCITTSCDRESHRAAHNWLSVVTEIKITTYAPVLFSYKSYFVSIVCVRIGMIDEEQNASSIQPRQPIVGAGSALYGGWNDFIKTVHIFTSFPTAQSTCRQSL